MNSTFSFLEGFKDSSNIVLEQMITESEYQSNISVVNSLFTLATADNRTHIKDVPAGKSKIDFNTELFEKIVRSGESFMASNKIDTLIVATDVAILTTLSTIGRRNVSKTPINGPYKYGTLNIKGKPLITVYAAPTLPKGTVIYADMDLLPKLNAENMESALRKTRILDVVTAYEEERGFANEK